jgi:hypothetical protein
MQHALLFINGAGLAYDPLNLMGIKIFVLNTNTVYFIIISENLFESRTFTQFI